MVSGEERTRGRRQVEREGLLSYGRQVRNNLNTHALGMNKMRCNPMIEYYKAV